MRKKKTTTLSKLLRFGVVGVGTIIGLVVGASIGRTSETSGLCSKWRKPTKVGSLATDLIDESSGLATSKQFPRFYHINDSGGPSAFFVSDFDGAKTIRVNFKNFSPRDPESLAMGPCPKAPASTCLAIADIGDNSRKRKSVQVAFFEEKKNFPSPLVPLQISLLKYPDGAHDAEAMALWPNGDLIIVTKEQGAKQVPRPAQVFRARHAQLIKGGLLELERLGSIDVPNILKAKNYDGLVTGMSTTSDGSRFLLLTYGKAIEFAVDLSSSEATKRLAKLKHDQDYRVVPLTILPQQEAITYAQNDRDFYYTTEVLAWIIGSNGTAPIHKVSCK